MQSSSWLKTAALLLAAAPLSAQPPPAPAQPPCTPGPTVVCGQNGAEDLVPLGDDWVAASALAAPGGVRVIRVGDRTPFTVYPAANARDRLDRDAYPDCPGPPDASNFTTHGLYADPDADGPVFDLLVVGHGAREAIEIFEIDTSGSEPTATWIGCAIAPDPIGLNSVRALPDGGFVTTNFLPRGEGFGELMAGVTNGELWEWHKDTGWQEVPGSEASGANGVELSDDLQTIYVAGWGSQSFFRLTRGGPTPARRDEIDLGFRIDNIHWARDGTLWGVGQAGGSWKAVKIDPDTFEVRDIVEQPDTPEFSGGTALVEVGDTLWVGSFRGNRIVIIPAP